MRTVLFAAALAVAGPAAAAPPLVMTCHEMLRGTPSPDVTTYRTDGRDFWRDGTVGPVKISTAGALHPLGSFTDKGRRTLTFATHDVAGQMLVRRVYYQPAGGRRRLANTERYDFARQVRTDGFDRQDSCHHRP